MTSIVHSRRSSLLVPVQLTMAWLLVTAGVCYGADEWERSPIHYSTATPDNAVSKLNAALESGEVALEYDPELGYLRSLLRELQVPESSQMLVYSKTSMQRARISPRTPRAIYFNDDVYVGYCQNGKVLEISAADPQLGAVFYTMEQAAEAKPKLQRETDSCLLCHGSSQTRGVPGHVVRSVFSDASGQPILSLGSFRVDHTTPIKDRWGGWYVTGKHGEQRHLGNLIADPKQQPSENAKLAQLNVTNVSDRFNAKRYANAHSDLVALMVFEHQAQAHNLITRANHLTRVALEFEVALNRELGEPVDQRRDSTKSRIADAGEPLVKYLLFSDEAKLTHPITGTSGYAEEFAARGKKDSKERSLRDLDLEQRLFKYPMSYMIYTSAFDALPDPAKQYFWQRVWEVLHAEKNEKEFAHLSAEDKQAILQILLETKQDLPSYYREGLARDG